jgi:parallel beta-helix repeat protein
VAVYGKAPELVPDRDNIEISASTTVKPGVYRIADGDGNGVIHVVGDNITVDFQGAELVGAADGQAADTYGGKGVVITGKGVTVQNVKVRGFKVGIYAHDAPGLCIEDVDLSDNYRQRLKSTPQREATTDWLSPHHNDEQQWLTRYGAGLYIERSDKVMVRRVRARRGQNGIILDRVNDSRIYDNDCSFLSGWGLALWRSSRNIVSRNAFDFCVRGYSHGVYNRGQASAGILMFEQNNDNVIAENSATHCGDGIFGFGGSASLAGTGRTGNNGNLLIGNDFSYAAAHGIEMTFSFDNRLIDNRATAPSAEA